MRTLGRVASANAGGQFGLELLAQVVLAVLAGVGLWLGGYPGAIALPLATIAFLAPGQPGENRPAAGNSFATEDEAWE